MAEFCSARSETIPPLPWTNFAPPFPALARHGKPEIVNTDQGSQFTSFAFTGRLQAAGIRVSMDGRGRCMDNIFIERLWRSLKYEAVYLHEIADGLIARRLIGDWVRFYNLERPHSALDGRTPAEAYRADPPVDMMDKPLRALPTSPQAQQQQKEDRAACKTLIDSERRKNTQASNDVRARQLVRF